jgi:hypothetical protein
VNKYPCAYEIICAQPFEAVGNDRIALHFSQNCPSSLVESIEFNLITPNWGDKVTRDDDTNHSDEKCLEQPDDPETHCTSFTIEGKFEVGHVPSNDSGLLLPDGVTEQDFDFTYHYFVNLPGGNDVEDPIEPS